MDDYLTKPLDSRALCAAVERAANGTPSASTPEPAPAIETSARLLARVAGDRQLLAEISRLFVDDAPAYLERIRQALDRGNAEELRRAAHALKGAAANFEADAVVEAARTLEDMGHRGTLADAEASWRVVHEETSRLMGALQRLAATA
jgi:HPt (histidine-containing phosphotransfer) domain-containing protein